MVNFVNNAVKYGAGSSHIELEVEKLDGFAKISVKDFGPGIPEEQFPHLFERYWQADKSTKSYSGLGWDYPYARRSLSAMVEKSAPTALSARERLSGLHYPCNQLFYDWEAEIKGGPVSGFSFCPDVTAMPIDDFGRKKQTYPKSRYHVTIGC